MIHWMKESRFEKFSRVEKVGRKKQPEKIQKVLMSSTALRLRKISYINSK